MKNTFYILITSLFFLKCSNVSSEQLTEVKIARIVETSYQIDFNENLNIDVKLINKILIKQYDINGNLTIEEELNSNKKSVSKYLYAYNGKNEKTEITVYYLDTIHREIFIEHSDKKQIIKHFYPNERNPYYQEITIYDSLNRRIKLKIAGLDMVFDTQWEYEYDLQGNETKSIGYQNSAVWQEIMEKYDNNNNLISYRNDLLNNNSIYKYNSKNQLIQDNSNSQKISFKYDSNGNISLKTFFKNDKSKTIEQYKYDNHNSLIQKKIIDKYEVSVNKNEFKYDLNNNWIEIKSFNNNVYVELIERNIKYYK